MSIREVVALAERNMVTARIAVETAEVRFALRMGRGPGTFNRIKTRHPADAQPVADRLAGGAS